MPDALYGILCREHARGSWHGWGTSQRGALDQRLHHPAAGQELAAAARIEELKDRYSAEIDDYALIQWLLAQEHQALRERLKQLGLALYGDLQVGFSQRDEWAWQGLFLEGYCMGAPPSRTNPSGQPWGYAVLDPAKFGSASEPGPVLRFVRARIARVLTECDGLRIDHPHGWVDPWVYRTDLPDPFLAVQHGTRLFSSPDEPEHPRLASHAIARTSQINRAQPAYADRRVTDLDDAQVGRYSMLVDEIVAQQRSARHATSSVACEVLSTLPYPVGRVLERHGLGRFRVIQKADLTNPADVYRVENAQPQDWIMLGTHDTPPIWHLAEQWCRGEQGIAWARYLSNLLAPASDTESRQRHFTEAGQHVQACFSAMLASRARHVVVFFPDLLGMTKRYNEPGVVSEANWSLRVPSDFESVYTSRLARDAALNVRAGFSRALRRLDRSRPDA